MMNTNKLLAVLFIAMVFLLIAVGIIGKLLEDSNNDYAAFKTAMSSQLKTFTDKNGDQVAQVTAAVFASRGDFNDAIKQLNASGVNIQSQINNNTQGLILLSKKIGATISGNTKISGYDTVKNLTQPSPKDKALEGSGQVTIYPTYAISDTTNKWYRISGTVDYQHFKLTPVFLDSTELTPQLINNGFWKASVLGIQSLSKNPYSATTGLKYLVVKKTPAPFWRVVEVIGIFGAGAFIGHRLL